MRFSTRFQILWLGAYQLMIFLLILFSWSYFHSSQSVAWMNWELDDWVFEHLALQLKLNKHKFLKIDALNPIIEGDIMSTSHSDLITPNQVDCSMVETLKQKAKWLNCMRAASVIWPMRLLLLFPPFSTVHSEDEFSWWFIFCPENVIQLKFENRTN